MDGEAERQITNQSKILPVSPYFVPHVRHWLSRREPHTVKSFVAQSCTQLFILQYNTIVL